MSETDAQNRTPWTPSPNQAKMLDAALEAGANRSIVAICKAAGVGRRSFYEWLKEDADFKTAWESIWQAALKRHLPPVVASMLHKASKGNVAAARLIAEMAGVLKHQIEHGGKVTHEHEGSVLVIGGSKDEYIAALHRARNGKTVQVVQ